MTGLQDKAMCVKNWSNKTKLIKMVVVKTLAPLNENYRTLFLAIDNSNRFYWHMVFFEA